MNVTLREEKKFLISFPEFLVRSRSLSAVLHEDEHNGTDGYAIRSLYFDSLDDGDLNDKLDGLEIRRKIRLRCYEPSDDFAFLEMKQKQGNQQKKRSVRLRRADAVRMIQGDYTPLLSYKDELAVECYGLMRYRCYIPRSIVVYRRKAFVAKENQTRITFDSHLAATESCFDLFAPNLNLVPIFDPFKVILEVKYNGFLLSYIKDLLNFTDESELAVSKYCLARRH